MTEAVSLHLDADVAIVTVNNPPVNALSHAVREGIHKHIGAGFSNPDVRAIVLACDGRTFMAGADIKEFGKPIQAPSLRDVIEAIEAGPKPVVAALHGTALGGGFETALCCHYRIANTNARVGLPEVKLGILPGAGGTQRTPRLIGVEAALDLMITGDPITAPEALKAGLIDEISGDDLLGDAITAARRLGTTDTPPRRVSELPIPQTPDGDFFTRYRKRIARKTRGLFSPERIVQCVEQAVKLPVAEGLVEERRLFEQCMASPESAGLRHIFFAERQVSRVPGIDKQTPRRTIDHVGVVGAGTMGGGIAMALANAGLPVTIVETDTPALDRGLGLVRDNYMSAVARGRMSEADATARIDRISGSVSLDDLGQCDLVIEAVFENLDIKQQVFKQLDRVCKAGAILATNTSTLDVDAIAAVTNRPADVLGLHFFSPANIMRLLEIVRGEKTADDVLASCIDLSRRIQKTGVVSGVCFGFIGNRMLEGYMREANFMLLEGVDAGAIDKAVYDFGFAMGPNAVADLAGLDVPYRIREELRATGKLPDDPRYGRATDALVEAGRHGQKTSAGVFRYETGSRTPLGDPVADQIIGAEAARLDVAARATTAEEIVSRVMAPLINEGALILAEGIALRPGDIDTVWTAGYGFPRHRGGPMFYADTIGAASTRDAMRRFADEFGNDHGYWTVAPLLDELADSGGSFRDYVKGTNS